MFVIVESDAIKRAVQHVAELMIVAAKTAPKGRGVDNIVAVALTEREELERLASKMEELAEKHGEFFRRDATNVRNSDAVVVIGCRLVNFGLKRPESAKVDPDVFISLVNLGIAVGSAAKMASILNIDNRIMYTVGLAALELKIVDADVALGIPLSVRAKNIYFDRVWPPK